MNVRFSYNKAKSMLLEEKTFEEISNWTGLSEEEIEEIRKIEFDEN